MKVFFAAQTRIGDCISSLVSAKYFKKLGYYTIGLVHEKNLPFCGVHWLDEVWSIANRKYVQSYDPNKDLIVTCSWENINLFKNWQCQVICPQNRINNLPPVSTYESEQNWRRLGKLPLPHHELFAWRLGIYDVDEPEISIPRETRSVIPEILLHQGSEHCRFRHMGNDFITKLFRDLSKKYHVLVVPKDEASRQELCKARVNTLTVDLATFIRTVYESKIVVTPDCGTMHIAYAMKKPMVAIETFKNIDWVIKPYPALRINTPEMRKTMCPNLEKCMKYKRPEMCQIDFKFLSDYNNLYNLETNYRECYVGCHDFAECIHNASIGRIVQQVEELAHAVPFARHTN